MNQEGAPQRNTNAVAHGLHSQSPAHRVSVAAAVTVGGLAEYATTLSDAALWVADVLAEKLDQIDHRDAKLIGLYAGVASELAQLVGELEGGTGIKPAALGQLSDTQFETMMRKHAEALALVLSQCVSAWKHLQDHEELAGDNGVVVKGKDADGNEVERANPVLNHLAAHMRSAKRIIRDMAADRAWQQRGVGDDDDLVARILKVIKNEEVGQ